MNRAHSANSRPSTGPGSSRPTATPARPPPTQYAWNATWVASRRGCVHEPGAAAVTAYASSVSAYTE